MRFTALAISIISPRDSSTACRPVVIRPVSRKTPIKGVAKFRDPATGFSRTGHGKRPEWAKDRDLDDLKIAP